jgi:hypothetical protein
MDARPNRTDFAIANPQSYAADVGYGNSLIHRRRKPMRLIHTIFLGAFLLPTIFAPVLLVRGDATPSETIAQLQLQTSALTTIDELQLDGNQLRKLQAIAAGCADPTYIAPDEPTGAGAYRDALTKLRAALVSGDENQIAQARAAAQNAKGSTAEADFALSDMAKANGMSVVPMLSTTQYAKYISLHVDEIPDAATVLIGAMDQCRQGNDSDFVALRDRVVKELVALCFGEDGAGHPDLTRKSKALLEQARNMKDDEYKAERDDLQANARSIIEHHQGLANNELENWVNNQMVHLLSNPELTNALVLRIRALHTVS